MFVKVAEGAARDRLAALAAALRGALVAALPAGRVVGRGFVPHATVYKTGKRSHRR